MMERSGEGALGRDDCHPDLLVLTLPSILRRTMFLQ
jgi:hypothetical protein